MDIISERSGARLMLRLSGTAGAADFERLFPTIRESLSGIAQLRIDCSELNAVTSGGLRLLLMAQNIMDEQGSLTVANLNPFISSVLRQTGFDLFIIRAQEA